MCRLLMAITTKTVSSGPLLKPQLLSSTISFPLFPLTLRLVPAPLILKFSGMPSAK